MAHEQSTIKPCIQYDCIRNDDDEPVCGQHKVNREKVIFPNECYYLSANSCGRGKLP